MVHYAGYAPRFHPSDFETRTRDGVGADWPIAYRELKPHYERVEAELPVAGQDWPWGDPHRYPHAAHPVSGGADRARAGARAAGIEMRVGPVAIPNGVFGNRPHCIYRGFCLQGCKVNAKASPLITHLPDAIAHGVEVRADSHAVRVEIDETGRCTGVTYMRDGRERFQRAAAVAVAGYSIETPRLLLNSTSARWPHGLANAHDQVGRYIMVQGAPQVAGRFPDLLRQYKAPPPEISLRAVLRDRPGARVRARLLDPDRRAAADRLGRARARRRPLGPRAARVHARLQPLVHARRAQRAAPAPRQPRHARRRDRRATACRSRAWTTRQSDNDRANIAYAKRVLHDIWEAAGAQDTLTIDRYAHLVGGCRMGTSPENSVIDADHRAWGVPNLFIADGSVMPTQGSANPALTIMALASRLAERLDAKRVGRPAAARARGARA